MATQFSARTPPVVTDFYEWGPWVNGGAWIHTTMGKVDFLYRNLEQGERTIQDAWQGVYTTTTNSLPLDSIASSTWQSPTSAFPFLIPKPLFPHSNKGCRPKYPLP